jgi:hypothetical protein
VSVSWLAQKSIQVQVFGFEPRRVSDGAIYRLASAEAMRCSQAKVYINDLSENKGYTMIQNKLFVVAAIVLIFCSSIASAEVVYDTPLIGEIEFADTYNSVISNLILNYYDNDGNFDGKETGLWKGDYMGDSHFRAIDNLSALALDSRFLSGSTDGDRLETRHDLLEKVMATIDYSTYVLNRLKTITGNYQGQIGLALALSQLSPGEMYAALSGAIGYASGFEMVSRPDYPIYAPEQYSVISVKPGLGINARNFTDLILRLKIIDVIRGDGADTLLDLLTTRSMFPES